MVSPRNRQVLLEGLWKKKTILIVCLVIVLLAVLAYFHRPLIDRFHLIRRRLEIGRILEQQWAFGNSEYSKRHFQVIGPLTIAQVETELFGKPLDSDYATRTNQRTDFDKVWAEFKSNYKTGDELYFFTTDNRSWDRLMGQRGYVVIRSREVVDSLVTFMN